MARTNAKTTQITFRIPKEWLERADLLATKLSRPGNELTRTDALRVALATGLEIETRRKDRAR